MYNVIQSRIRTTTVQQTNVQLNSIKIYAFSHMGIIKSAELEDRVASLKLTNSSSFVAFVWFPAGSHAFPAHPEILL